MTKLVLLSAYYMYSMVYSSLATYTASFYWQERKRARQGKKKVEKGNNRDGRSLARSATGAPPHKLCNRLHEEREGVREGLKQAEERTTRAKMILGRRRSCGSSEEGGEIVQLP